MLLVCYNLARHLSSAVVYPDHTHVMLLLLLLVENDLAAMLLYCQQMKMASSTSHGDQMYMVYCFG